MKSIKNWKSFLVFDAFFITLLIGLMVSCKHIGSWDLCEKNPFCEPIAFTVTEDFEGPTWTCLSRVLD